MLEKNKLNFSRQKESLETEELNLLAQLIESMDIACNKLDEAVQKSDIKEINKIKSEIIKFQKQISLVLG
ncbi:MAG: hypothetical protein ABIG37_00640 [Nanoarchaeota archaeon]|nr:hypothetical protein [Nanoarchaeota archaeon]